MTLSDPVGAGEIARRAGVVKATVWSWQKRHSDFPAPVQLEMGPVWDWAEVEAWLREHGRTGQAYRRIVKVLEQES